MIEMEVGVEVIAWKRDLRSSQGTRHILVLCFHRGLAIVHFNIITILISHLHIYILPLPIYATIISLKANNMMIKKSERRI